MLIRRPQKKVKTPRTGAEDLTPHLLIGEVPKDLLSLGSLSNSQQVTDGPSQDQQLLKDLVTELLIGENTKDPPTLEHLSEN